MGENKGREGGELDEYVIRKIEDEFGIKERCRVHIFDVFMLKNREPR
jgi:hypothetical protein